MIVEGDKDSAKRAAETTLRLQSTARWLLSWPDTHSEPPVLIISVDEKLLGRFFQHPPDPLTSAYPGAMTHHESWLRTPSLVVVTVARSYERGYELRPLQHAYGEALLQGESSQDWPKCVHVGMSLLFASAELTPPNRFFLSGEKIRPHYDFWNPERFLTPTNAPKERLPEWDLDQGGYSCYLLSFMIASAVGEQRIALEKMLTAVGRGAPLGAATLSELQETQAEFTARYREFGRSMQMSPQFHQIRVEFPEKIPMMPEPAPLSSEELHALLGKLCGKLQNCRK